MSEGMQYNVDAGKAALDSLEQLGLFDKIRLLPSFDPEYADRGGILLHILVREHPCQSVSLKGEWSFLAKESGWPDLVHCPLTLSLLASCLCGRENCSIQRCRLMHLSLDPNFFENLHSGRKVN